MSRISSLETALELSRLYQQVVNNRYQISILNAFTFFCKMLQCLKLFNSNYFAQNYEAESANTITT